MASLVLFGLPWWFSGKESACQCRRCGFLPWVRKIPWRRKCNPLQYYCLENSMDRGAWWALVHGVTKEPATTQQLNKTGPARSFAELMWFLMSQVFTWLLCGKSILKNRCVEVCLKNILDKQSLKNPFTSPRGRVSLPGFVAQQFVSIITINSLDGKAEELLDLDNNGQGDAENC